MNQPIAVTESGMMLPAATKLKSRYSRIETPPIASVDTVGVRNLGWIFENDFGIALYAAIASVVRAVGRIVVWVEAAADESTIRVSSLVNTKPKPCAPKTALPRTVMTSLELSGLARPIPLSPTPAKATVETDTKA